MLVSGITALFASVLYLYASALIWQRIQSTSSAAQRSKVLIIAICATVLHAYTLSNTLWVDQQINFHIGNGLSLVALLGSAILLITNINKSTETLGIFIYPFAALTTLLPLMVLTTTYLPFELGTHVLISISAYSIMGIATAQAILYAQQERLFRTKKLSKLMNALPPLQVMETTLVQLILIGFVFLSFALISGALFIENMFAQHLVHKTFFAVLSWLVYAVLLLGHFKRGWRGQKAATYSIWAYFLLILSYIGTELTLAMLR
ncbi:cytochrome C assembly family protein [Thiomicrorhabdus aquaedulcis]|uniref:cytochrome C assembly family protein n=1 Tax=Thiomicrorhabdus aquaedulcis TaxID=2211106 RepID=UPI000FD8F8E4|nr:cytochrome c biogenesis protein CcsA [Thiomicrorhabdus aquaedulcis]